MPRRQTERLAYRPRSRGARLSLFHLKLTDSALQALLAYQRLRVAAPRPVIAFQGSQGYLKVPCAAAAGRPEPRTFRFTFYLSRYSKEQPQASFDCVRQSCSRPGGHERLESRGAIQEKITICAAVESSQLPRSVAPEAHSQAPPATWPTLPHQARKPAADPRGKGKASSPLAKKPPTPGASCAQLPVLLQPLEGEPAGAMRLGLQERPQVQAETQERSYKLEEQLLEPPRQEHGPEYTPQQHQEAAQLLQRKQAQQALAGSFLGLPSERFSSSQAGSPLRGVSTWQRHCRSDLTFQRLQPLRAALGPRSKRWQGPHFTGAESSWWGRKMEPVAGSPESSAQSYGNKLPGEGHSTEEAVAAAAEAAAAASNGARESKWPGQTLPPALQGHGSTPAETLSYYLKYVPIHSVQQYRAYKEDFSADYTIYRHLHARIGSVSRRFAQLGTRIRLMQHGTEEYKVLADQILQEYRHFKKVYPNYQKEKRHCEYLHQKLSHIKGQILNFEQHVAGHVGCGER